MTIILKEIIDILKDHHKYSLYYIYIYILHYMKFCMRKEETEQQNICIKWEHF